MVGLLTTAALALRLWGLDSLALDLDDYFQIFTALKAASVAELFGLIRENPHHLLADPLLSFVMGRVSDSATMLRLPSVLLGAAAVPLAFALGRRVGGARVGLCTAALLAFSMLHLEWSRRVNFYSALVVLTLASVLMLLRAVERRGLWPFAPYAAVQTLFFYTHPYGVVVSGLEAVWLFRAHPGRRRDLALALAAAGALFAPWYLFAAGRLMSEPLFAAQPPSMWASLLKAGLGLAQFAERTAPFLSAPRAAAAGAGALLYLFLAGLGLRRALALREPAPLLCAGAVVMGLVSVLSLDRMFGYFFEPRQALLVLPFYLVLAAYGLDSLRPRSQAAALAGCLAAFINAFTLDRWALSLMQTNLVRAAETTAREAKPGELLVFDNPNAAQVFLYHFDRAAFLSAEPPRLYRGFYQFRLKEPTTAGPAANRVVAVADLSLSQEEQARRWDEVLELTRAGNTPRYFGLGYPVPGNAEALARFRRLERP